MDYAILMKPGPGPGGVRLVRRPLRALMPDEALVRISRAAICGTDLHILGWNAWVAQRYKPPFALGHEFSGVVIDAGPAVIDIHVGDKVAAETHLACGHCSQCIAGRGHTCLNLRVFSRLDCGAFTEYAAVPAAMLRVLPESLPHKYACLMEPLGIGVRAVLAAVKSGGTLVLAGLPEAEISLDLSRRVILREVTVRGIYGRRLRTTWRDAIALMPALIPALDHIVTHEFPLDRFDEAFATALSGKAGKVQFVMAD